MANINSGMLVKFGGSGKFGGPSVTIETMVVGPKGVRFYNHTKTLKSGQFLFGTVEAVCQVKPEKTQLNEESGELELVQEAKYVASVLWNGSRYRTSTLPVDDKLQPAIK